MNILLILFATLATMAFPTTCANGQYILRTTYACTTCPAGYYCVSGLKLPCPSGTYSTGSASSCTSCTAGNICPSPATAQTPVTAGSFSIAKASEQFTCSATEACPSSSLPQTCNYGTYIVSSTSCSATCASGSYCVSGVKTTCSSPYYTPTANEPFCSYCLPGYSCNGVTTSVCAAGTYWNLGACTACSEATDYCPNGRFKYAGGFFPGEYYSGATTKAQASAGYRRSAANA